MRCVSVCACSCSARMCARAPCLPSLPFSPCGPPPVLSVLFCAFLPPPTLPSLKISPGEIHQTFLGGRWRAPGPPMSDARAPCIMRVLLPQLSPVGVGDGQRHGDTGIQRHRISTVIPIGGQTGRGDQRSIPQLTGPLCHGGGPPRSPSPDWVSPVPAPLPSPSPCQGGNTAQQTGPRKFPNPLPHLEFGGGFYPRVTTE